MLYKLVTSDKKDIDVMVQNRKDKESGIYQQSESCIPKYSKLMTASKTMYYLDSKQPSEVSNTIQTLPTLEKLYPL